MQTKNPISDVKLLLQSIFLHCQSLMKSFSNDIQDTLSLPQSVRAIKTCLLPFKSVITRASWRATVSKVPWSMRVTVSTPADAGPAVHPTSEPFYPPIYTCRLKSKRLRPPCTSLMVRTPSDCLAVIQITWPTELPSPAPCQAVRRDKSAVLYVRHCFILLAIKPTNKTI